MRALIAVSALLAVGSGASAQYYNSNRPSYGTGSNPNSHYVQPHYQRDGDFVGGYHRTNPNSSRTDNYGAPGNYNPHSNTYGRQRRNQFD